MKRVLIVEDNRKVADLVRLSLENAGFQVTAVGDGVSAMAQVRRSAPDLVVLDIELPKLNGMEVCRQIRGEKSLQRLPILMLTGRGDEMDRVLGLELGADDYVTKPFSPRELVARIKAVLRRAEPDIEEKPVQVRNLQMDPASYRVTRNGNQIVLSTLEFRLLYYLASHANRVFSRDQLLDAVWGAERFVTPRSVDVYIQRLREKVEEDPENPVFLKTQRGAGYLFEVS